MSMSETGLQIKSPCGSHQTHMPMEVQTREAMMTVETVRYCLRSFEFDEDDTVRAVASGDLVAWNIAVNLGENRVRELRVWGPSAEYYRITGGSRPRKWNWNEIVHSFFPPSEKPWLTGVEVQHAFNCGSDTITRLIDARLLELVRGTNFYSGPKGSPAIQRDSVIAFLEDRVEVTTSLDLPSFFRRQREAAQAARTASK